MRKVWIACCIVVLLTGCAAMEEKSSSPDYEETKKMMVDMLHTEDGKKALQEVLSEDSMRETLVMDDAFVAQTVQKTLASEEGKEYWSEVMKDPEFAKTFATQIKDENEQLLKGLMKDPEYQQMMENILMDPQMEQNYMSLLATPPYRQQIQVIVGEAMESPLFMARVSSILEEIAKKQLVPEQSGQGNDGGGSGGGGDSGGSSGDNGLSDESSQGGGTGESGTSPEEDSGMGMDIGG
ncbi:spore gernimation protein GerD [Paenalkalicoccus suaedae]|uniref:Spore gernimation protein GerD n=1 Tax=Paenalkalicoccus suaedae TaxID=2592382 RepID=A0A859FA97_9BACI|nr:spore germination lipoprotein GerD [Paenalkalicoccus suaedae]QKS69820.1 spore gernimation protein GerD [Paenalkalicoccus suaedae]